MRSKIKSSRLRYVFALPCFFIFSSGLLAIGSSLKRSTGNTYVHMSRSLLQEQSNETELCIPSGIHSFPGDFFTQEQRQTGGVLVHFLILFYACAMIAIVCDCYFIPALEVISDKLKLPPDVAGATFMAIGASSPELFSSILGSFVTEGDIGVGAVIGSAVFNILGITGVAGIALWNEVLDIDWYPMVRDCIAYGITVLVLVWIISDNIVKWWEAVILLGIFFLYILLMYFNRRVEKCTRNIARRAGPDFCCCCNCEVDPGEKQPLLKKESKVFVPELLKSQEKPIMTSADTQNHPPIVADKIEVKVVSQDGVEGNEEEEERRSLCTPPSGCLNFTWWLVMFPASALFTITIPDPTNPTCRKFFALTFLVAIAWLGVLSYVAVWMVTIIGYTLSIPDAVSGLTILAVGASVPDLITTVIVAKSGQGNMAISNLVGSNNFDISICLGVPWLGKALISETGSLKLYSSALSIATATLLLTLILFFLVFQLAGWKLNRTVGLVCLLIYALFVVLACLFEFNVFGEINLPTCYP
ncbi:hypothetical protein JTE90_002376 [Oedothorax gibbosus]|uniref:Sodium/calcium exchanger membrane region domain-containing protein n=1 Tax=Oedothorax gibbosus TaxID=931172 RepID=A0AAV6VEW6_9ARAC|nr:hypothetical protein JTE90_002376 [Oedothorax gibbosus]